MPIIEEHHYYGSPPVVIERAVVDQPQPEPLFPPTGASYDLAPSPLSVAPATVEILRPWHARFGIEYGSDVNDLSRFGFDLIANKSGGLGIDTGIRLHREQDADFRDYLWLGDFNVVYELFPTEYVRPRAGIGINWLADGYGAEAGLNLTVGADFLLTPALVLSSALDFGTLGDADLFHESATVGIMQTEHLEWFAGYDHLDVGGVQIQGVVGGIRFRF